MNQPLGRLLIVTGLPGAGKSHLIESGLRQRVTGLCIHDFHGNAIDDSPEVRKSRHFLALVEALKAGHDCIIADIEFCRRSRREVVVRTLQSELPSLNVEYHSLRNQPDRCIRNVIDRDRAGKAEECDKIRMLSQEYVLPMGAIEYDVIDN
jgi:hypothetical protein